MTVPPSGEPTLHVVLHQPEIPQNAGNIGRTCLAVGGKLWMIKPLGFSLEDRYLKRAGLDYWPLLDVEVVPNWQTLTEKLPDRKYWYLTKRATKPVWEAELSFGDVLVFGCESAGLPPEILEATPQQNLTLPMRSDVRSLNLASTVTAVVYEAVRQQGGLPAVDG